MLATERLILRPWQASDRQPFSVLNACPETMRYFPAPLTEEETDALIEKCSRLIAQHGWGFWAVERKADKVFLGMTGLHYIPFAFPNAAPYPHVDDKPIEIGWRFAKEYWGQGYATEAAHACLDFGFQQLQQTQLYAFTATNNAPSWRVMERIGMQQHAHFMHPVLDPQHALAPHVLYQITE